MLFSEMDTKHFLFDWAMLENPANHTNRSAAFSTLQAIFIVMITGISFGILMSIVSNAFVIGVDWLFNTRHYFNFLDFSFFGKQLSPTPLITLLCAVFVILFIRRIFSGDSFNGDFRILVKEIDENTCRVTISSEAEEAQAYERELLSEINQSLS